MKNFKSQIALILEVENVELHDELESFECWDSLTILSIIALAEETYQVELSVNDVKKALTIGGLQELIECKSKVKI